MAQPGGSMKRKRPDRVSSQDRHVDQPPAKSPRGARFPNNVQANPHAQNRDGGHRGGRGGNRAGSRLASNPVNTTRRPPPPTSNSSYSPTPATPVTPAPGTPHDMVSLSVAEKQTTTNRPSSSQPPKQSVLPPPRYFETMTDEVVQTWQDSGKPSTVEIAREARKTKDHIKLIGLFQEIIYSGLDERIDAKDAGDTIHRIISDPASDKNGELIDQDITGTFLDTVAIACSNELNNLRLRDIILATKIPHEDIVLILTDEMLIAQKLVRSTFNKMGIRHQTNVLYRQDNYNLLREETEGYSKLVTELFTTMENESPTNAVAKASFERVKAMIGSFNLDVGRVLDVTMDVFASLLVKHNRFVVKFLHNSAWWPGEITSGARHGDELMLEALPSWSLDEDSLRDSISSDLRYQRDELFWDRAKDVGLQAFFELGGRRADISALDSVLPLLPEAETKDGTRTKSPISNILRKWVEITKTLPPQGNVDAAQILGFKLRFYNSSARDADDNLPSNLIFLAALLIKIGFISFLDLYPHLWPFDDDMVAVEKKLREVKAEKEKDRKPGGKNALELAGALIDDTLPPPRKLPEKSASKTNTNSQSDKKDDKPADEAKKLPEPIDQKIQLLKSLLLIGAIPEALFMIGRFPWLIDLVPELPEHVNRIIHQSLDLVYNEIKPLGDHGSVSEPRKFADPEATNMPKGSVHQKSYPSGRILRWAQLDKADGGDGIAYKFYWEDWSDTVPMCHSVDDVFVLCATLVNISGMKIGQDSLLMAKLARIGIHSLATDNSDMNKTRWINLSKRLLVPATSLSGRNSGTISEVWALLKTFKLSVRYNIYFEWFTGATSRNKDIQSAFAYTQAETRDVMKKVTKNNTKAKARQLSQIAIVSPGKVFEVVIKQIESYPNMIMCAIEASQYFTDLTYDALVWSLVNALGRGRSRVQHDGMLASKWLQSLSEFIGQIYKRYRILNPGPVLQFVANQLQQHKSNDLTVLEDLIFWMAGTLKDANFTGASVVPMCGGAVLREMTLQAMGDQRNGVGDERRGPSTRRLMKALGSNKLIVPLLVGISQERQACIFDVDDADVHLKLLSNFFDQLHRILTQYLDLIHSNLPHTDFKATIPSLKELIHDYGIDPTVAFSIWRPVIAADIAAHDKILAEKLALENVLPAAESSKDEETPEENVGEGAKLPESSATTTATLQVSADQGLNSEDVIMKGESPEDLEFAEPRLGHPVVRELIDTVSPVLRTITFEMISELFYFTFWRLSPSDLHVPETYQEETKKIASRIESLKNKRGGTSSDMRKREAERKELVEKNSKLTAEFSVQLNLYQKTKNVLVKEKDGWFSLDAGTWDDLNIAILEHCFIPRMLLSEVEAFYVFKTLKILHSMGTKNFRTMGLLDQFFSAKRLLPLLFSCTERETKHLARFIFEVLKDLHKWHASKDLYEKEAFGAKRDLLGFSTGKGAESLLDHESFRTLYAKWHRGLHDTLRSCLESQDFMHISNGMSVLNVIQSIFPAIEWHGKNILKALELLLQEKREDLKLVAVNLHGAIDKLAKTWVSVPVFARSKLDQPNGTANNKVTSKSPTSNSTEKNKSETSLNAKAPVFVPKVLSIDPAKKRDLRGEAEDGEIRTPTTAKLSTPVANTLGNSSQHQDRQKPTSWQDERLPPRPPPSRPDDRLNSRTQDRLPPRPDLRQHESKPEIISRNQPYISRPSDSPRHQNSSQTDNSPRLHSTRPADRPSLRDGPDARDDDHRRSDRSRADPNWGGERNGLSRSHDDRVAASQSQGYVRDDRNDRNDRTNRDGSSLDIRDRYRENDHNQSGSRESSRAPRLNTVTTSDRNSLLKTAQEQDRNYHSNQSDRRHDSARTEYEQPRSSRPPSPNRRGEDSNAHSEHRRYDDRSGTDGRRSAEYNASRNENSRQSVPRSDYHNDTSRPRDEPRSNSSRQDPGNGWLDSRPSARPQDSNYGRLNQDPPAGPRTSNPNTAPIAPRNSRAANSPPGSSTSPTSNAPTRGGGSFQRPAPVNTAVPAASAQASPETAGIHPDRLKALQGVLDEPPRSSKTAPIQAPAGPKSAVTEPSNATRSASSNSLPQNGGRGREDKRFSGVNNILSQSNAGAPSDRPAQNGPPRVSGGSYSEMTSPVYNGPKSASEPRNDSFANRPPRTDSQVESRPRGSDYQQPRSQESTMDSQRRPLPHNTSRDNPRPPNGEFRDSRGRGIPQTPPMHNQDRRQPPPADRSGRRDSGRDEWVDQRSVTGPGPRREAQQDSGRKRPRVDADGYDHSQASYDHTKRPRRG